MPKLENSHTWSHRYEILQHLGEGGIGNVYRAFDAWTKKDVALKVLTADFSDPSVLQHFRREFLLLTRLKHPGVVEVFDFGYCENAAGIETPQPYFTMEFVEGRSLRESFPDLCDPRKAKAQFEALYQLIRQICDVLEFLHLRGTVHCDLKPDNLKLTGTSFNPKILDFGLFERIGAKRGQEAKGTLPYMAPEMFDRAALDERSDLYSLGVVLYEVVTSRLPFPYDDPVKIVSAHLQEKPTPPSELNPHLPPSLNQLIMKSLEKSPADRPRNAARMKEIIGAGLKQDFNEAGKRYPSTAKPGLAHLHSGPLVKREKELQRLEWSLKQTVDSNGAFLLISGEQGVGKTALLQRLKIECQLRGIVFVDSHCLEDQTVAYQPLMQALHRLSPYVESKCAASIFTRLQEVLGWSKDESSLHPEDRTSLHRRISDLLAEISRFLPFAVAVENLQWADSSTLQFLEYFQRQGNKGHFLLCGSLREEELKQGAPLAKLKESCLEQEENHLLKVNRLDSSGTGELISSKFIRSEFPASFFAHVHERTAGNPFFIIEVLKYLVQTEVVFLRDSVWTVDAEKLKESEVPDSVEAVLLKNLERYDQNTLDFLNTAAVIGKRFALDSLMQLKLAGKKTLSEMASSLVRDQMLTREEESGRGKEYYRFANQSLQSLLYQRVDKTKRISLHNRVAQLLEKISLEDDELVFEVAFHYLEGEDFDKAYQYALESAEKMKQRFANDEVLIYLKNAIEVAGKSQHSEEAVKKQATALKRRADFCRGVGDLNQAEKDYQAILQLLEDAGDLQTLVETYNGLGETYRLKHDFKKGISALERAMRIHQKLDDPLRRAYTLSYMGLLYWTDSQFAKALDSFEKALEIDRKLGDKYYMASTLNNMGLVYWSQRQYHEALKRFTDSLSLYKDLDNKEWIARSLNNIGQTHFCLGEYDKAIRHCRESLEINERIRNDKERTFNLENLSEVYRKTGDYSGALECGRKGLKLASAIDFTERVGRILKDLGVTHFEMGEYQQAYAHFQQAREVAETIKDRELQILVLIALTRLRVVLNDHETATRLLEEAGAIINAIGDKKSQISVYQIRSLSEKREGRLKEASKLLAEALALAKRLSVAEEILSLNLECANLHVDQEDPAKSKECLGEAMNSGLERFTLLHPLFHLISGRAEWVSGDSKSARAEFETALGLAEKLNQPEIIWQIHHRLGKLLLSEHEVEQAYQHLRSAGAILKRLSHNIENPTLRQSYLKDPGKRSLLSDLQKAAKELVGEASIA